MKYATISELNSQSSAFCGMFYDPKSTFIVLAFKGTSPEEFSEWACDFKFQTDYAGHWIKGFGKCHGGFLTKIFPRSLEWGTRMPYNTIKEAIRLVAPQLLKGKPPGTQINVWTTGHSLGCALASLVYARQINEPGDFGRDVVIRDAYLFAAPILCDVESVCAFNNRMHHASEFHGPYPRTMWRVTNGCDIVATGLPHMGDHPDYALSPYNLFSFAHIGAEIKIKRAPKSCIVRGNHITPGSQIHVASKFDAAINDLSAVDPNHERIRKTLDLLEKIPLFGRLLCHWTVPYWVNLRDMNVGPCEWGRNH